jgi:hypothetical protein
MRHLGSIVLSVVSVVVIYVLAGIGMVRLAMDSGLVALNKGTDWTDVGIGIGSLAVAGALYAILTLIRLSPLGTVLGGLLFVIVQLWALFDQSNLQSTLGSSVFGTPGAAEAPLTGLTIVLAIPLLATIFSPRRWRGKDKPAVATAYAPPAGQSTYAQPGVPQPGMSQSGMPQSGAPAPATPPAYGQNEPMPQTYVQPPAQTYAAPPAATNFPQPTYAPQTYAQPTSAAPAYTQTPEPVVPQPVAPQQTTPENAGDAQVEDATVIDPDSDTTNQ